MTRYRRHETLRLTALEGEGVVLHMGTRTYFTVTETGLTILEALVVPKTLPELVAVITSEYDVDDEHAETTVKAFLDRCIASTLIIEESS